MNFEVLHFTLHILVTFAMTGIIWFVELIHYPVMHNLKGEEQQNFEKIHWNKTMKLAVPMLCIEAITALLLILFPPDGTPMFGAILGGLLLIPIWITTWGFCVPSHCALQAQNSKKHLKILMGANRLRAYLWSMRSIVLCSMVVYILSR